MVGLKQLQQFAVLAEELHFGRAARRLNMAQPPLSMVIRKLEEELDVKLFDRSSRRVDLTQAGAVLLQGSYRIAQCLESAVQQTKRAAAGLAGLLELGYLPTCSVLPNMIRAYRATHPDVNLRLTEATTAEQLDLLGKGQIHVGILRPPGKPPDGIAFLTVAQQKLIVALPEDHPLASHSSIALSSLAADPFVITPPSTANGLYHKVVALCRTAGFAPTTVEIAREVPSVMALVAGGVGIAIVPQSDFILGYQGVQTRPIAQAPADCAPVIEMQVAWSEEHRTSIVDGFIETVRGSLPSPDWSLSESASSSANAL